MYGYRGRDTGGGIREGQSVANALSDGVLLCQLAQVLCGLPSLKYNPSPSMSSQKMDNCSVALQALALHLGLAGIDPRMFVNEVSYTTRFATSVNCIVLACISSLLC